MNTERAREFYVDHVSLATLKIVYQSDGNFHIKEPEMGHSGDQTPHPHKMAMLQ